MWYHLSKSISQGNNKRTKKPTHQMQAELLAAFGKDTMTPLQQETRPLLKDRNTIPIISNAWVPARYGFNVSFIVILWITSMQLSLFILIHLINFNMLGHLVLFQAIEYIQVIEIYPQEWYDKPNQYHACWWLGIITHNIDIVCRYMWKIHVNHNWTNFSARIDYIDYMIYV